MHITKLTGKLDGFRSLSSNTTTNPFCIKMNATNKNNIICKECYSMAMLKGFRKNEYGEYVIKAWCNGKRYEEADYYTDDYDDAVNTMNLLRKEHYND